MRRALLVAVLAAGAHAALAVAAVSVAPAVRAEPAGPAPKIDPEVQKHFALGNDLYGEQRYADALIEYDAAYDLSRNWKILFNRGQCLVLLRREPEAIDSFQRYLDEGAKGVDPERRKQVENDIGKLKERLGFIVLVSTPDGTSIEVDGRPAATTPLTKPIAAGAGMHEVTARPAGGGIPVIKQVKVIAGQQASVTLELPVVAAPTPGPTFVPAGTAPPPAGGAPEPPIDSITPPPPPPRRPAGGLPAPAFMLTLTVGGSAPTNDTTHASSGGNKILGSGELGVSWRLNSFWELGLFAGGGVGKYGGSGAAGTNADYSYGTYGLRARIHPIRGRGFDGWLGFDVGGFQEKWAQTGTSQVELKGSGTALGLAFGVDFPIARTWALGGVMRYVGSSRVTCESAGNPAATCPSTTDARSFVELGLRVVWDLPYGAGRQEPTTASSR